MRPYRCHASTTAGRLWRIPEFASLSRITVRRRLLNDRHDARPLRKREGKPGRRLIELPAASGSTGVTVRSGRALISSRSRIQAPNQRRSRIDSRRTPSPCTRQTCFRRTVVTCFGRIDRIDSGTVGPTRTKEARHRALRVSTRPMKRSIRRTMVLRKELQAAPSPCW